MELDSKSFSVDIIAIITNLYSAEGVFECAFLYIFIHIYLITLGRVNILLPSSSKNNSNAYESNKDKQDYEK
jgi:hypothetical protein